MHPTLQSSSSFFPFYFNKYRKINNEEEKVNLSSTQNALFSFSKTVNIRFLNFFYKMEFEIYYHYEQLIFDLVKLLMGTLELKYQKYLTKTKYV